MSSVSSEGKWVWNVLRIGEAATFQLNAGQLEVDSNGLHLCNGPGHCGGLIASFPLGTVIWREDLRPVLAPPKGSQPVEMVINITCHGGDPQGIADAVLKLAQARRECAAL